jgi:hypothetical protein
VSERGHYRHRHAAAAAATAQDPSASDLGIPGTLFWAYRQALNRQADLLFWQETHYKPNQALNPDDPRDQPWIPKWWAARAQVAASRSAKDLIRAGAVEKTVNKRQTDPQLFYVYSAGPSGAQIEGFSDKAETDRVAHARVADASYVAIFVINNPKWPQPVFEVYPRADAEIEIDPPPGPPNVSGDPEMIYHEGLVLHPLTRNVVTRWPDLDPARHDAFATASPGWLDFNGRRQPPKLISAVYLPGDSFYYWDDIRVLAGSRGIAVVRGGQVVETFGTAVS